MSSSSHQFDSHPSNTTSASSSLSSLSSSVASGSVSLSSLSSNLSKPYDSRYVSMLLSTSTHKETVEVQFNYLIKKLSIDARLISLSVKQVADTGLFTKRHFTGQFGLGENDCLISFKSVTYRQKVEFIFDEHSGKGHPVYTPLEQAQIIEEEKILKRLERNIDYCNFSDSSEVFVYPQGLHKLISTLVHGDPDCTPSIQPLLSSAGSSGSSSSSSTHVTSIPQTLFAQSSSSSSSSSTHAHWIDFIAEWQISTPVKVRCQSSSDRDNLLIELQKIGFEKDMDYEKSSNDCFIIIKTTRIIDEYQRLMTNKLNECRKMLTPSTHYSHQHGGRE